MAWTLIDDINLVDPKINNNIPIEETDKRI